MVDATFPDPENVFVIVQRNEPGDHSWAELEEPGYPKAYRTRAAATARMATLVPEGEDPFVYGGYFLKEVGNDRVILQD